MFDPRDDTDVPSGSTDGAPMESTSRPVSRRDGLSASACAQIAQDDCGSPINYWETCAANDWNKKNNC